VTFGGTPAVSFFVFEEGWIEAVPPAGAAGKVDVTVTTPYGSATKPDAYTYIPAPAITSVSPDRGPLTGGATVTISGTGFTGTTGVKFGSAAATYTVVSDTQIDATAPAGSAGAVSVAVTTEGGTGSLPAAYTYAPAPSVTSVSPYAGPLGGGTTVTIDGSNFTGATLVTFSGVSATNVTVVSDTRITAVTPANSQGTVTVRVTTPCGSGDKLFAFYYAPAPGITSVNQASGPEAGGNSVTITGSNFTLATAVTFGGIPAASYTVDSDTQITAVTPSGSGTVSVTVTTAGGTGTAVDAYEYLSD
jgi:hypothetical protein